MNGELFTHEKLEAYKVACEFLALADGLIRKLPRGTAKLAAVTVMLGGARGDGTAPLSRRERGWG